MAKTFFQNAVCPNAKLVYENETLWMTQKIMVALFDVNIPVISKHLHNIFDEREPDLDSTVSKMETVQNEGKRTVTHMIDYYNLYTVIFVGYRVISIRATQFRRWTTQVFTQYAISGYVIDRKRTAAY